MNGIDNVTGNVNVDDDVDREDNDECGNNADAHQTWSMMIMKLTLTQQQSQKHLKW